MFVLVVPRTVRRRRAVDLNEDDSAPASEVEAKEDNGTRSASPVASAEADVAAVADDPKKRRGST